MALSLQRLRFRDQGGIRVRELGPKLRRHQHIHNHQHPNLLQSQTILNFPPKHHQTVTMPGTAAVHNPAGPADQQIHLFYNTNNTNIALELRSEKKTTDTNDQVWASSSTDQPGFVVNPSQLASAPFAGTELVVGFTKKLVAAGTTATTNDVSIVSPVYQSVGSTEVNNTTIAACASDDTAWIYFLT